MAPLCGPDGVADEITIYPVRYQYDIDNFLFQEGFLKVKQELIKALKKHRHVKFQLSLKVQLSRYRELEKITLEPHFNSETSVCLNKACIVASMHLSIDQIISWFEAFNHAGSGWFLERIIHLKLLLCKYVPFKGGTCKNMHKLPANIKNKRAVLTINCPNNRCFIYAVLASIYKTDTHPGRYLQYKRFENKLEADFLTFPVKMTDIPRFEERNHLSVNVFGYEKVLYPLHVSTQNVQNPRREVDLLYYKEHFYPIRSLSRLLSSMFNKMHHRRYICRRCLSMYKSERSLEAHKRCCASSGQVFSLPPPKTFKKFTNHHAKYRSVFTIFYDFESILKQCKNEETKGTLKKERQHVPISFAALRVSTIPKFNGEMYYYAGLDCVDVFLEYLKAQALEIDCIYDKYSHPIDWNDRAMSEFEKQKSCSVCGIAFSFGVRKCADHNHLRKKDNFR